MSHEPSEFPNRFRAHVELQGAILTPEELSRVGECYPRCRGKDHWDVREYASGTGIGAREYRVVRGTSTVDVYRSTEREHASAVQAALNELESQTGGWRRASSSPTKSCPPALWIGFDSERTISRCRRVKDALVHLRHEEGHHCGGVNRSFAPQNNSS